MPLSAARVLHVSSLVLLLLALTAAGAPVTAAGIGNTTSGNATLTATGGGSSSATADGDSTEMYICYLCGGRNPLLMRYCPIYWPYCHANCHAPAATPVPSRRSTAIPGATFQEDDPCYVMKLFQNGSYVIVGYVDCTGVGRCSLSCGGGDVNGKALGASPVPAPSQGMLLRRVADFQRCGSQATARAATRRAVPGGA